MKTLPENIKLARAAGGLYLSLILTGIFAHLFVRASLIERDDATKTAENILNSEFIFRLGFVSDLVYMVSFVLLGLAFYRLFKQVNSNHSRRLLAIVLVATAMSGINMLNQFAAFYLLSEPTYLQVFTQEQLQALSLFFLNLQDYGIHINYLFFGLWLYPLGHLVLQSDLFQGILGKVIAGLLLAGSVGYVVDFSVFFVFPNYYRLVASFATIPADLGELMLCCWLLIKGALSLAANNSTSATTIQSFK